MAQSLDKLSIDKSVPLVSSRSGRFRKQFLITAGIVLFVITAVIIVSRRPVSVETVTVSQVFATQSFTLLNASGYIVAQRKAAVASKTTGRLEWIGVEEGSRVSGEQVIARLENRDLQASLRQAEAVLQNARSNVDQAKAEQGDASRSFDRQKKLLAQGIVSQAEFDAAEARYKRSSAAFSGSEATVRSAEAALEAARVALDYSMIKAPFDAVVLTKNADVGDIITPLGAAANAKAAVVTIADLSSLQVEADVSESNLVLVKKGQPCEITLDALPGGRFRGVVHTIVPTADRSKASVMIKVRFIDSDPRILPDMSAKVAFLEREAGKADQVSRTAVSPGAVTTRDGRSGVWLVTGESVMFRPVSVGGKLGDLVEISGVSSGDRVVARPTEKLRDGARITIAEKKK